VEEIARETGEYSDNSIRLIFSRGYKVIVRACLSRKAIKAPYRKFSFPRMIMCIIFRVSYVWLMLRWFIIYIFANLFFCAESPYELFTGDGSAQIASDTFLFSLWDVKSPFKRELKWYLLYNMYVYSLSKLKRKTQLNFIHLGVLSKRCIVLRDKLIDKRWLRAFSGLAFPFSRHIYIIKEFVFAMQSRRVWYTYKV
jgi:hypothetical protein